MSMRTLKDLGKIVTGNTPKMSERENFDSADIPFIKPGDISDDSITVINKGQFFISENARDKARILPSDSILVTCIGIIGKVGILTREAAFNQQINGIVPDINSVIPRYLAYAILSQKSYLQEKANAAVVPIINKSQFSELKVEVPNLQKQNEIVRNLDKVDHLISLQKQQLKGLDELVKSRFIEMFGNVGEIDKHKVHDAFVTKLGDVANVKSSHRVFTSEFVESGIPFYRGTEIGELSNGQIPKHPFYITREHYEKLANDDSRPKIGDLLLPSICNNGQIWLVDTNKPFYYKDGRVLCISPYPDVFNSIYLLYYLKYRLTYEYPKLGSGSTFAEFKIFQLKNMDVLVPNIMKQNLFANFIHQVDKSKLAVQKSLDELEILKKSLMQQYFG